PSKKDPRWKRLTFSDRELRSIGRIFQAGPADLLVGFQATETAVMSASRSGKLARCRYIHFATHGVLGAGAGRQPGLVLTRASDPARGTAGPGDDGFLQLDEIMRLKLNADLVVLSACETGRGKLYQGEGVRGLARGFIYAGAKGVVCSLWPVLDQDASEFMEQF